MFYTRSNGMRVPATVVGFAPDGLLHLEYFQDAVKVVNRQCKVESISFAIPSADSPPPSTRSPSPPPDDRGRSPSKSATPSPPRVTFTCVEVAWMSILAILMFPSSP